MSDWRCRIYDVGLFASLTTDRITDEAD